MAGKRAAAPNGKGTPVKVRFDREYSYFDAFVLVLIGLCFFTAFVIIAFPSHVARMIVTQDGQAIEYVPVNAGNDVGIGMLDGMATLTVTNANRGNDYIYYSQAGEYLEHEAQEGSDFIFVTLDVWNAGKEAYDFKTGEFRISTKGFDYPPITYRKPPDELKSAVLEKGEISKGTLLFEVPDDSKGLVLTYKSLSWKV